MTATLDPRTRLLLEAPIAPTLLRLGAPDEADPGPVRAGGVMVDLV